MQEEVNIIERKALSGIVWKFLERIIAKLVSLVVSVIIARILSPDDYSVVSIVAIFFTFSDVLISGGLNTALIQKSDADKIDYSTVFWISMSLSVFLYGVLYFAAPIISRLYNKEILISVIRVMALILPVNAAKSIACAYISSNLDFKNFFIATIGGTIVSAVVGIVMAYKGYGAWALVAQQMTNSVIDTLLLFVTTKLTFDFCISFQRLKSLWSYGWKVFVSSIIGVVYSEINPLVIGLKFSSESLSFYDKGRSFPQLVSTTTTNTLAAVLFPFLAKFQNDKKQLLEQTRNYISLTSYVVFPLMVGLYAVGDKFILLLLTEKWASAVPYLRIFCIAYMFDMINIGNCETIKAMGRSDIYLLIEIIKKTGYFIVIGIFLLFSESPILLACSSLLCTGIAVTVNSVPNKKLIGYSYKFQIADLLPNLGISTVMGAIVWGVGKILDCSVLLLLIVQILVGVVVYVFLSYITRNKSFQTFIRIAKSYLREKK